MNSPDDELSTPVRTNLALGTHIRVPVTPMPREGLSKGQGARCPNAPAGRPFHSGTGEPETRPTHLSLRSPLFITGVEAVGGAVGNPRDQPFESNMRVPQGKLNSD